MKKTISIILSFVLLLSVFSGMSINAFADDNFYYNRFECRFTDDNNVEIVGYNADADFSEIPADPVNIPNVIYGKKVTSIASTAFIYQLEISEVRVSPTVKNIGEAAFYGCSNITNLELTDGIETIGDNAFNNCSRLMEIHIGNNVKSISPSAFANCYAIKQVTASKANSNYRVLNGVLFTKDLKQLVMYPPASASVTYGVPEGVEVICENAFAGISNLKNLYLPNTVKTISDNAFVDGNSIITVNYLGTPNEYIEIDVSDTGNESFKHVTLNCNAPVCENHIKGENESTVEATCSATGKKVCHCTVCGKTITDIIAKKAHTVVTDKAVAATYFAKGKTKGSHCSVCKTVIVKQKAVAKLVLATPNKYKLTAAKKGFNATYARNKKATGYQVQYSTSKKFTKKTTKTKTIKKNSTLAYKFRNKKLKKKTRYYVRVRAYVKSGNKTAYSKWSSVKTVKTK